MIGSGCARSAVMLLQGNTDAGLKRTVAGREAAANRIQVSTLTFTPTPGVHTSGCDSHALV